LKEHLTLWPERRPYNNALQQTSGGLMRASRALLMSRLQLSAVFDAPEQ
jgi:hypothetical protein